MASFSGITGMVLDEASEPEEPEDWPKDGDTDNDWGFFDPPVVESADGQPVGKADRQPDKQPAHSQDRRAPGSTGVEKDSRGMGTSIVSLY